MNLRGKKLLILGGNPETGLLVEHANRLGVVTLVADPNPNAPAKAVAARRFEVDGFDIPGLADIVRSDGVEGVLVGVADILVQPYARLCAELNLPCYATEGIVAALTTKDGFRHACAVHGIAGIPGFRLDHTLANPDLRRVEYPVLVKPVDSGGGIGVTLCANEAELIEGVRIATAKSRSGRFMVERYMQCDDMFAYYTFQDGEVYLSALGDRVTTRSPGKTSPVCIGALYPSRHLGRFEEQVHPRLCEMFRSLGVKNGVLMIQFFVEGDNFYAYDPGFRLQGEAPHLVVKAANGFDHREMLIRFALTGSMGVADLASLNDVRLRGMKACTIWVLLRAGRIGRIRGVDPLRKDPAVISVMQRFREGDLVDADMVGNERQVFSRIHVLMHSWEEVIAKVEAIRASLEVRDETGDDMVVEWIDPGGRHA